MTITVFRRCFTEKSTIGGMEIDGAFQCYTLEPRRDRSIGKPYCIPPGTYKYAMQYSPRFEMATPHLQDVPGFFLIEIHPGNTQRDTEGCTLVGQVYEPSTPDFIGKSRLAYAELIDKIPPRGEITYTEGE